MIWLFIGAMGLACGTIISLAVYFSKPSKGSVSEAKLDEIRGRK